MKKAIIVLTMALAVYCAPLFAQDDSQAPPEGMEYVQISTGYKILVPKGTRLQKIGEGLMKPEDINTYIGRKFTEQEQKINQLQDENRELRGMIEDLRKEINDLKSK